MIKQNTRIAFTMRPEQIAALERYNGYEFIDADDLRAHVLMIVRRELEERSAEVASSPAPDREGSDGR